MYQATRIRHWGGLKMIKSNAVTVHCDGVDSVDSVDGVGELRGTPAIDINVKSNASPVSIISLLGGIVAGLALFTLAAETGHAGLFSQQWTWPKVHALVRERFPDVTHISTTDLDRRLMLPLPDRPLLLDARSPQEYAISQIKDALPAFTEAMALKALAGGDKARPVVVYCSVGYRSAELARKLIARGYSNVANLEGSLFAWANEGRPIYAGTRPAERVHPYNAQWGVLLKPELRDVPVPR